MTKKTNRTGLIVGGVVVVLAIVIGSIGVLANKSSTANTSSYSATIPGPGCDKGSGVWTKLSDTSDETIACKSNGFLLTQTGGFDGVEEVFFNGASQSATFPASYRVQVDAAVQSSDPLTGVTLDVHRQTPNGGQYFIARANSEWIVNEDDTTGQTTTRLGIGFLPQATKTLHLDITVSGTVMTFAINNVVVDTIVSTTYKTTDVIGLGVGNPSATGPIAALFSNFSYQALADSANTAALATATAVAQTALTKPYTAAIPGPGCDTHGAQWAAPSTVGDTTTTSKCVTGALEIGQPANQQDIGEVRYYGVNGTFPAAYSISVVINVSQLKGGFAGIFATPADDKGGYAFEVSNDGSWYLLQDDGTGTLNIIKSGNVAVATSYTMKATLSSTGQSLSLNGKTVGTYNGSPLTGTNFVALNMLSSQTAAGSATFKNFVFTPLTA